MKRFVGRVLLACIGLFLLAEGLDVMVTQGLRKTDIRKYAVWNDIFAKPINADLVVIGSSRAWCGYNTYVLDTLLHCNSYNLGLDGHSFDAQLIRFNTFARYNPLPKVVLLNVDFMSTLHSSSDSQYEREQYFPYIKDDSLINAIKEQKRITMAERYLPFWRYYGYREEIGNGLSAFWGNDSFFDGGMYKGYRGNNYAWSQGLLAADTIVDVVAEASNSVEKLLDAYLDSMTQKDVKVLLVKSPIYDPLFAKLVNVEYSDSVFMSLSQKYDIPLLDYYHSDISADSTFFYNPSHLNQKGAEAFTRQLCDDIISMGLLANTVSSK